MGAPSSHAVSPTTGPLLVVAISLPCSTTFPRSFVAMFLTTLFLCSHQLQVSKFGQHSCGKFAYRRYVYSSLYLRCRYRFLTLLLVCKRSPACFRVNAGTSDTSVYSILSEAHSSRAPSHAWPSFYRYPVFQRLGETPGCPVAVMQPGCTAQKTQSMSQRTLSELV